MDFPPYIAILDFEATCDDCDGYMNEIIEFPTTLLRWNSRLKNYQVVDHFQEYCKPKKNSLLTPFCTKLTGITQSQVNSGGAFPDVLERHHAWLKKHVYSSDNLDKSGDQEDNGYGGHRDVVFMTVGHWDLRDMMPRECARWGIFPPAIYREYINLKDDFQIHHGLVKSMGMAKMLEHSQLELLGHHHCGLDDCKNTARIWIKLVSEGYRLSPSSVIQVSHDQYGKSVKSFS